MKEGVTLVLYIVLYPGSQWAAEQKLGYEASTIDRIMDTLAVTEML